MPDDLKEFAFSFAGITNLRHPGTKRKCGLKYARFGRAHADDRAASLRSGKGPDSLESARSRRVQPSHFAQVHQGDIMRHKILAVLFVVCTVCVVTGFGAATPTDAVIDQGWEFRQLSTVPDSAGGQWRPAQVPGDVHLDLLRNKLIPDPFFRDNEAKLQWIEGASWEYRTTINVAPETLKKRNLELVFEGLDAYAEVFLNDTQVLTANNMFRIWRVNAKPLLHAGANQLRVVFPSPDKAAAQAAAADPWRLRTHVEDKTYVRKAAYEYGWDWGPTFVTSGVWRPVHLEAWDEARISDLHVRQLDVTAALAHLNGEVEVTASGDATADVTIAYSHAGKTAQASRSVALHQGLNHIDLPLEIAKPELWYPAGYGGQPLYKFTVQVKTVGRVEDEAQRDHGSAIRGAAARPR